ncbi:two-component system OmpR family response regulator [Lipingzhangella halophila]|uniref:Two-component system OmpR family response regulator n=1 Tax=Lipingzhangella halophila TaxID=1783352 RepID=A0A7W7RD95_9ACTN|nr:response regulator transcription factor [Lipingzhangella halophila]MBB4929660.1 two-component system OmpR family response regulator [Lipingzhangella halophila]
MTTSTAPRVLVVDDEDYLADLVATALRYEGFTTVTAGTAAAAASEYARFRPDLIVLDVMLPDGSGVDLCRRLRAGARDVPVVFLTARDSTADRVAGLTAGGDDYVPKPFSLEELVARVRAVLRRTGNGTRTSVLTVADLEIDEDTRSVRRGGHPIDLTPTEYKLLRYLVVNAGRVLSQSQILDHVWEYDFGGSGGVVQTYISYLRRKVDRGSTPLIRTLPRVGYMVRTQPADETAPER